MMKGMQEIQKKMLDREARDREEEAEGGASVEYVRGSHELPKLACWSPQSGPIDLNDWLALIEPIMSDLTQTSQRWWQETLRQARQWYSDHMDLSPLERIAHDAVPTESLKIAKWVRLERRASNMLLVAVPEAQREELVSTKRLTVLQILCHLLMIYQPGGLAEKEVILSSLENPPEGSTIADSLQGLRKWMRWRRRAAELAVSEPDPFLLLKGLGRIVRRPLEGNKELNFRVSLARSNLQVDSNPTSKKVNALAIHLVAELEQVAHLDQGASSMRKPNPKDPGPPKAEPKVKKFEAPEAEKGGAKAEGKGKSGKGHSSDPCRFFLTEGGCKKGKECSWLHQLDDQRRCWNCGARDHYADKCARPSLRGGDAKEGKGEGKAAKTMKKRESEEEEGAKNAAAVDKGKIRKNSEDEGEKDQTMKELLEEATKMLKKISKDEGGGREEKLSKLQKQLDDLKTIRTLRLARLQGGPKGLLDSGATHPLRGRREGESLKGYKEVTVSLAGGKEIKLHITKEEVMVSRDMDIEPIVPLGLLIDLLGCEATWKDKEMMVWHPSRGRLRVEIRGGCPEVEKEEALRLIQEIEEKKRMCIKRVEEVEVSDDEKRTLEKEKEWLKKLIEVHPVFREVPQWLKDQLYEEPAENLHACGNRKRRKLWKKEGLVLHVYAGAPEGFGLARAVHQAGGDQRKLVEVDWERDEKWNMLPGGKAYAMLLRMAMNGWVRGVVGGPNCRTRSVLRHIPLSSHDHGPRPLRSWEEGQEWGRKDLSPQEAEKVMQDDVLMLRFLLLFIVAEEVRKANGMDRKVQFLLEQPGAPKNPEVVTWWATKTWKMMKRVYSFQEVNVDQWDWGGSASKWTTLGTSMKIERPLKRGGAPKREREGKEPWQLFEESRALARWAPGLMIEVAERLQQEVWDLKIQCRPLSWCEHVRAGHVPFRRDCRICQESRAKGQPHRRVLCPKVGVLSIDMSGPLKEGRDLHDEKDKFLLIATFTWPKLEGREMKEDPEERLDEAPEIEDAEAIAQVEEEVERKPEEEQERRAEDGEDLQEEDSGGCKEGGEEEEFKNTEVEVHRMVMPLGSKSADDVLRATIQLYLRLKSEGFEVQQIHTDRGAEFYNPKFRRWCEQRCILKTWTPGDDPQSNGRCERAVQEAKGQIRTMLKQAGLEAEYWPLAARHLNERWMAQLVKEEVRWPPFMSKVLVRKRGWRAREFEPTQEEVIYLFPSWDSHGHWIADDQGRQRLSRTVMDHAVEPITDEKWIALEDDENHLQMRRRLRQKMVVRRIVKRKIEEDEEESQKKKKKRAQEVLRETSGKVGGMVVIYIDDLLIVGEKEVKKMVIGEVKRIWETSTPEEIDEKTGVRFLGMELWKLKNGDWMATQRGYVKEMLRKNLGEDESEWRRKKTPITKSWIELPEEEKKEAGDVKEAQRVVGEVMWVMTRTRPDLLHTTSMLASQILKKPKAVREAADQLWAYLAHTWKEGLLFAARPEEHELRSYTDASFGEDCQGCTIVALDGAPIAWKAGKQHAVALSTAEAELTEILEGLTLGDSIRVVAEEMREEDEEILRCVALTDNQAATSILADSHGSWRTRYLRMKAKNARWRIQKGDWQVMHVPGATMPADMGTKPVSAQRLEDLKKILGMKDLEEAQGGSEERQKEIEEKEERSKDGGSEAKKDELERLLKMIVVATSLSIAKGHEEEVTKEAKEERSYELWILMMMALWGTMSLLWSAVRAIQFCLKREKKKGRKEEEEEELQKKGRDEEKKEMKEDEGESKASKDPREETNLNHRKPGDRVLSSQAASSHEDPQGNARKSKEEVTGQRGETSSKGKSKGKASEPGRRPNSFQVLVTDWGNRYHMDPKCPTLANSRRLVFSPWCQDCAPYNVVPGSKLKIQGPGHPAHAKSWCGEGRWYQACARCCVDQG